MQSVWHQTISNFTRPRIYRTLLDIHFKRYASSSKTVFALSSGSGKCGVAVIRVSGPNSKCSLQELCGGITKPRVASLRKLINPHTKEVLDKAIVLWFPGPNSFTGEDCAEFHIHGGPAVISSVLSSLGSIDGFRPAQAGDFTKQAFVNGKMDLTEVEGLGDLIHAETEAQRKQALRQMEGELGQLYAHWRTRLIKCLANTEAFIDFHEEENIEDDVLDSVLSEVGKIQTEVKNHLNDSRRGERLRDGVHVVIVGEPNVGKSSLLNAICQRPAAIVSPIAGTTRDVVETALNIGGYPVLVSDTAGLRETVDVVEKEGVSRAISRAAAADIKILLLDAEKSFDHIMKAPSLSEFSTTYMHRLGLLQTTSAGERAGAFHHPTSSQCHSDVHSSSRTSAILYNSQNNNEMSHDSENMNPVDLSDLLIVVNKCDLLRNLNSSLHDLQDYQDCVCHISCKTGQGLDVFMGLLVNKIKTLCGDPMTGSPSLTQTRHRHHLSKCLQHLNEFPPLVTLDVVLAAERLRMAARELGQVTGAVSAEDVLDVIFRDFCIGK